MKRNLLLVFLTILVPSLGICQTDGNGNSVQNFNSNSGKSFRLSAITIDPVQLNCNNVRALSEVNSSSGQGYPWISNDGLRLYYSMDNGGTTKIYCAIRTISTGNFSNPVEVPVSVSSGVMSAWLTGNELDMYYIVKTSDGSRSTSLYHTTRANTSVAFSAGTKVTINGNVSGFVSAPSLTSDLQTLYIYNSANSKDITLVLNKTGINQYQLTDTLDLPTGYTATPGSISPNGLQYYLGITDPTGERFLYYYERSSTTQGFNKLNIISNSIIQDPNYIHNQPSISGNGKHIAFVRATTNSWSANQFYIADLTPSTTGIFNGNNSGTNAATLYPNPAKNTLTIDLKTEHKNSCAVINIYNASGVFLQSMNINSFPQKLDLSGLTPGMYFYQLYNEDKSISDKGTFIVND